MVTAKTPYWLTEDERPDELLFHDLSLGIQDVYGDTNVAVYGSSNAEYDGAWVRMRGTFHVAEGVEITEYSPAFMLGEDRFPPTLLCEGTISANMSKAELIRLRNAIDGMIETMEFREEEEEL